MCIEVNDEVEVNDVGVSTGAVGKGDVSKSNAGVGSRVGVIKSTPKKKLVSKRKGVISGVVNEPVNVGEGSVHVDGDVNATEVQREVNAVGGPVETEVNEVGGPKRKVININSCQPEDEYHSYFSEPEEEEVIPDDDHPDDDLTEQIKRVLRSTEEYQDFVKNSSRVYEEEEINTWNTGSAVLKKCWVGQEWATYKHCRDYIKDQQIFQNFDIKQKKNTHVKQAYECQNKKSQGCLWRIHCSVTYNKVTFKCRTGHFEHTCDITHGIINPLAKARWVFRVMLDKFKAHPDYKPKHFRAEVKLAHKVEISYMTAWHARHLEKGLKAGFDVNFSDVNHYHRYCFRHMWKNMKKSHPGVHMERYMDRIGEAKPAARTYLEKEEVEHWARSYFDYSSKCEHITSNFCEAFNSWILEIRYFPVC
ncbi:hypothetical protein MKW94_000795, partial [Papaver nudicaule]|nr:hypothetical protein [Papaver nudicaule]